MYNKTNGNYYVSSTIIEIFFSVPNIGQYFMNFGQTISNRRQSLLV